MDKIDKIFAIVAIVILVAFTIWLTACAPVPTTSNIYTGTGSMQLLAEQGVIDVYKLIDGFSVCYITINSYTTDLPADISCVTLNR